MQLDHALVPLRPRNMWEAADVGFAFARQNLSILTILYFIPTVLVAIGLWLSPLSLGQAAFILWWLKPMFEAPLIAWIGQAMFNERVSWRHLLTLWRQSILKSLLGNLLLRRLHWARGINLCIIQLEGAKGQIRKSRLSVLTQTKHNAGLLQWILFVFNILLELALISFLILMLPINIETVNYWDQLIAYLDWFDGRNYIIPLLISVLIQSVIGPFFTCSAFMLYINARTKLEAWDLEIAARRMQKNWHQNNRTLFDRSKLNTWLFILLTSFFVLLQPAPVSAQSVKATDTIKVQPIQKASDTQKEVQHIYEDIDTFGGETETTSYRWKHQSDESHTSTSDSSDSSLAWIGGAFAALSKVIFFAILAALVMWLIYKVSQGIRNRNAFPTASSDDTLPPLSYEIQNEHLPNDIALNAEQCLQQGNVRTALALLYQGTLGFYANKRNLPIKDADTENDFLRRLKPTLSDQDAHFLHQLIQSWVRVAYGHHPISVSEVQAIIQTWRSHYGHA